MAKVTVDNFADAVEEILDDYAKEVELTARDVNETVAKNGVRLLRSKSKSVVGTKGSKYPGGWAPYYHTQGMPFYITIHNKSKPGLAHLLEFSHPTGGGGSFKGRPHIKDVEETIIKTYERELKVKL